jgi:hypothetical protein
VILLREILGSRDLAFKDTAISGEPYITVIDNYRVFLGKNIAGFPEYTIVDNKIFKGAAISGRPLATLVGNLIFPDIQISGAPLARIQGNYSFKGIAPSGYPIVTVPSGNTNTIFVATYHALRD